MSLSWEKILQSSESSSAEKTKKMRRLSTDFMNAELNSGKELGKVAKFLYKARYGKKSMMHVKASEAFKKATHYLDMQASILSRNRVLNKCLKEMTPTQEAHVKHDPRESGKKERA